MDAPPENFTEPGSPLKGIHSDMSIHNRQPYQIAVTTVFLALAIPSVIVRLWVRKAMSNSLGADDYFMVVALVNFIIYNAALMEIVANGGGTHLSLTDSAASIRAAINWTTVNEVFYLSTQIFLKLSLGYFFLRVVIQKGVRRFVIATCCLSTLVNSYHILYVIFRCGNPKNQADRQLLNLCTSGNVSVALGYEQAAVSTITDLIFAIMPIYLLWNVTMDMRSKISAGLILSLGGFGSICSIVRFLYVKNLGFHDDFFFAAVNISIWSTIELGTGIVAGSLATMRPLLKRMVRSTKNHLTHNRTGDGKKSYWKSSITKPQPIYDNPESLPSIFRPWESVGESQGYTTTVIGGSQLEKELKISQSSGSKSGSGSRDLSKNKSLDILASAEYSDRAAIWPFIEDSAGIAKVVDVQVSVTESVDFDIEMQSPQRTYRRSEEGGGLWGLRFEDKIRKPERSPDEPHSRSSTPEWERLPDLFPATEPLGSPTAEPLTGGRPSDAESGKSKKSVDISQQSRPR
ncbi:hypothetical protein BT63DRAFT_410641 [Microthyrium microscopicum]|uniref:Rhodopsin domain-containing protein n=1 Tax=Microthyrium microscopicum TaxID=703497 RepID=A0A6A6UN15_9PEZI|nr:hypothetical protein BT63DRAFT_410641 [Microthyrium microscopicum]